MSDDCKHISQSVICPFCRERILMCPASERDTARQDAERARAHVRRLVNVATNWCHHSAHCECNACETVWQGRTFLSGALATPTPGPVPGRGLDPLTVEACAKLVEDESTGLLAPAAIVRIARRIRSLTIPADTYGRPNGK